ncbi:Vesicular glutamate transporter 2, partial [Gryllus bimaculatus]
MGILIFFSIFTQYLMRLSMMVGFLGLTRKIPSIDDLPTSDVCFDGLNDSLKSSKQGLILPSSQVLYSRWYPIKERRKFGALHSGSVCGMILAGLLSRYGWEVVSFCSGATGVLFFIPWALLAHESPLLHPRISLEERNYIVKGLDQDPNKPFKFPKRIPWFAIITSGPVWASVVFHTGSIWIMLVSFYHLPTFLMDILHVGVEKDLFRNGFKI